MNKSFLWRTLAFIAALIVAYLPLPLFLQPARPNIALLVVIYWAFRSGKQAPIAEFFFWGILIDTAMQTPLGVNALAHLLIGAVTAILAGRLRNTSLWQQAAFVLLCTLFFSVYTTFIHLLIGASLPSGGFWLMPLTTTLVWGIAGIPLLARHMHATSQYH